jgi:hypothetical protein
MMTLSRQTKKKIIRRMRGIRRSPRFLGLVSALFLSSAVCCMEPF